jgi:hypothetical protein
VPVLEYGDGMSPLSELADLNIEHWQIKSDFSNTTHITLVPQAVFTGVTTDELGTAGVIGPKRRIVLSSPEASAFYLQTDPALIDAGLKILETNENQQRVMGLDMMARKTMTATERSIDQTGSDSDLASMVRSFAKMLGKAIGLMHEWEGRPDPEIVPIINTEFGITTADVQAIQSLLESRRAGEITQETYLSELKRRGALDDSVDINEEVAATRADRESIDQAFADAIRPPAMVEGAA